MRIHKFWGLFAFTGMTLGTWWRLKNIKPIEEAIQNEDDHYDAFHTAWTKEEKTTPAYQTLLKRWGTREGLFDIDFGGALSKKQQKELRKKRLDHIAKNAEVVAANQRRKLRLNPSLSDGLEAYETTQVVLQNTTNEFQLVNLWGGNLPDGQATSSIETTEDFNIQTGSHPVVVSFNEFNNCFYIINQLSEVVQVLNIKGEEIHQFELNTTNIIGSISPVDLIIINDKTNQRYGNAYVVGSVSNQVYELTSNFRISKTFEVGRRPVSITFDERKNRLFVTNLRGNTISSIDITSGNVDTIISIDTPRNIQWHPETRNIYVFSSSLKEIQIFSPEGNLLKRHFVNTKEGQFQYFPTTTQMLFLNLDQNELTVFDKDSHNLKIIVLTDSISFIAFNPKIQYLYLGDTHSSFYQILDKDFSKRESKIKESGEDIISFSSDGSAALSIQSHLQIGKLSVTQKRSSVIFNQSYQATRTDFQHNPAIVKHIKIINQSKEKLNTLRLISKTITGKESVKTFSFRNYDSPQHFADISEIRDMQGAFIDGKHRWELQLPPNARITILLYHLQYDTYSLLPETARKSIGVEMSKGLFNWNHQRV